MKLSVKEIVKKYFKESDYPLKLNIFLLRISGTPLPSTRKENVRFTNNFFFFFLNNHNLYIFRYIPVFHQFNKVLIFLLDGFFRCDSIHLL